MIPNRYFNIICLICFAIAIQVNARECKDDGPVCHVFKGRCEGNEGAKRWCPQTCGLCDKLKKSPCEVDNGDCAHTCTPLDDKQVTCSCYKGYRLADDGKDCVDIDECAEGFCANTGEGFCTNFNGGKDCTMKDHCPGPRSFLRMSNAQCCTSSDEEATCGKNPNRKFIRNDDMLGRIVGGKDAMEGAWPWMTYIIMNRKTLCGGTLIDSQWVLTAGHCFRSKRADLNIEIYFGLHEVKKKDAGPVRKRKGVEVILHEKWNATYYPYRDVALIKLDKPVKNTNFIYPVCLPRGERPKPGYKCYVTGYGTVEYRGKPADTLQQVDVPIRTDEECEKAYRKTKFPIDSNLMFCAGYARGEKDACQGDSGGPLVCQRCETCSWYVYGITSFGYKCAEPGYYGVYTNVEVFEEWISNKIGRPLKKDKTCNPLQQKSRWSEWQKWSECSSTCGSGNKKRSRACIGGSPGSSGCQGEITETETCNDQPCPAWSEWTSWSTCSVSCGSGNRRRTRGCENGSLGDLGCDNGDTLHLDGCNEQACPSWGEWAEWSSCTHTCDGGVTSSTRQCINGNVGDDGCHGNETKSQECNTDPCPPPASWSEWSEWRKCSVTCGGGVSTTRVRICLNGNAGEPGCSGETTESKPCGEAPCPPSGWTEWGQWSPCVVTCGEGPQIRSRQCQDTTGPENCPGEKEEVKMCSVATSCEDETTGGYEWLEWSEWSECSITCGEGDGVSQRIRLCSSGTPDGCYGDFVENRPCTEDIPIKCPEIGDWGSWSECSVSCGVGETTRVRMCLNPADPSCLPDVQTQTCEMGQCLGQWSQWSQYDDCSASCGEGTKTRHRQCKFGVIGGPGCKGDFFQVEPCINKPCPVEWSAWGPFTSCTQRCNGGLRKRSRRCIGGEIGDEGCSPFEDSYQEVLCNTNICQDSCEDNVQSCAFYVKYNNNFCLKWRQFTSINCMKSCPMFCIKPSQWNSWGKCSKSCGGGYQERTRNCKRAACSTLQRRQCNPQQCTGFTEWSTWADCSVTCGQGTRSRTRTCQWETCLPDEFMLATQDTGPCPVKKCPGSWEGWGSWSTCSKTCDEGVQKRTRTCNGGIPGQLGCEGSDKDTQKCQIKECVGKWSDWEEVFACPVTCGVGTYLQQRHCIGASPGSKGCYGDVQRYVQCTLDACPIQWTTWTPWTDCTRQCGGGTQERVRICENGQPGGMGCLGQAKETLSCNTQECTEESVCSGLVDQVPSHCPGYRLYCRSNKIIKMRCPLTCCKEKLRGNCNNLLNDKLCDYYADNGHCELLQISQKCPKSCHSCS